MPNWKDVLIEMQNCGSPGPIDTVRHKYITEFYNYRKRNIIVYYSGFLQKNEPRHFAHISINDNDINLFMQAIHCIKNANNHQNENRKLDLILHTPGGDMAATEALINYLTASFDDIECFVPQLSMSAGTSIACSCNKIHMGHHSSIGPVDPQLGSISCYGLLAEYEYIKSHVLGDNEKKLPRDLDGIVLWKHFLEKYSPSLISACYNATDLAIEMLKDSLRSRMFKDDPNSTKIDEIVQALGIHNSTKMHARHISYEKANMIGLKVEKLESDQILQDIVMTIHHCCMHTFTNTQAIKIVETQNSGGLVINSA